MTELRATASLHEKTVQKVARGDVSPFPSARRRTGSRNERMIVRQVHPAVMEAAQRIVRPGQRIRIVSPTEVMIENVSGR